MKARFYFMVIVHDQNEGSEKTSFHGYNEERLSSLLHRDKHKKSRLALYHLRNRFNDLYWTTNWILSLVLRYGTTMLGNYEDQTSLLCSVRFHVFVLIIPFSSSFRNHESCHKLFKSVNQILCII